MSVFTRQKSVFDVFLAAAFLAAFVVSGVTAEETLNGPSNYSDTELQKLIEQLGASRYQEREDATSRLVSIGIPAKGHVQAALEHADLEIRSRCEGIFDEIVLREREHMMIEFLSGTISAENLPGWSTFVSIAGDPEQAKPLFARMLESEWEFIEDVVDVNDENTVAVASENASRYLANRVNMIQLSLRSPSSRLTEGTLCALLFAASFPDVDLSMSNSLFPICSHGERYLIGENREVFSALLSRVVLKPQSDYTLATRLHFCARYGLAEGVQLAREVVSNVATRSFIRQQGILLIARFGNLADDQQTLDKLLADSTAAIGSSSVQIRDVALAALIHLNGENPIDYGFKSTVRSSDAVFVVNTLGFDSEQDRVAAFEKWVARRK
ncbi:MAG: hypothetical protein KDB27_24770 [Planctomycetales bacterium]|nr:hypothetical protein [Planctomycetales bacterium]